MTAPLLLLLAGCNHYDLFRVAGYQQESFTNNADIVFVIDNSGSMSEENTALIDNLDVFIQQLAGTGGSSSSDGLSAAVDNYIEVASRSARFINFHIGVTSTDVENHYGALFGPTPVMRFGDPNVVDAFTSAVDDAAVLGGSGNEEGLEAVFMALCRAVPDPPRPCFDPIDQFTDADVLSNDGLIREHSAVIPVIITDEGDVSRRRADAGTGADGTPDEYDALFQLFGKRMGWAVIGPEPGVCETGGITVPQWTVDRYRYFVDQTDGIWVPISTGEPDCGVTDFASALQEIGDLINRLLTTFPLQAVPDPATLRVYVDGHAVPESTGDGQGGFTSGWSYDPDTNAVSFHGDAVPGYDARVTIYYLPVSGEPRQPPF